MDSKATCKCKCGRKECTGFYLLHTKEMDKIFRIKKEEVEAHKNNRLEFDLMDSPSSGEIYTRFKELHVLSYDK